MKVVTLSGVLLAVSIAAGAGAVDEGVMSELVPTGVAVAVQKNHPAALAYVTSFLENAKANGTVRRALDNAGLNDQPVARPEPRK